MNQPPPSTGSVVVGVPAPAPITVIGVDWAVLIPLIFAGISLLITTGLGALQSYRNGKKSDAIHVLVNSGMTKALADLAAAQNEIRLLRDLTVSLNMRLALLGPDAATVDLDRLPSAEVRTAKASTPKS